MRLLAAALLSVMVTLTASASPPAAASHTVTIEYMQFNPSHLTVRRGDRIVWVNKDLFPHTVTSDKVFDSGSIAVDASWSYVANKPGVYSYSCTFHPTMKGRITVQ